MNRFFLVWRDAFANVQHGVPKFRHTDYPSAETEAHRLAALNPGTKFFIVEAHAVVECAVIPAVTTALQYPTPIARADYEIVDDEERF